MLEKSEGVKTLSTVIQNAITHGQIEIRIQSAVCFQYLIDFSKQDAIKTEIIKICGALIRVVNDKFSKTGIVFYTFFIVDNSDYERNFADRFD